MTISSKIDLVINSLQQINKEAQNINNCNFKLIESIVAMQEHYRLNKNFEISDQLRDILLDVGIKIIQGTGGYTYENIPQALKGRQARDTWELC